MSTGSAEELRFPAGEPEETAALLFTAGTTGRPKAVMLSHASFTSFMLTAVEPPDPDQKERTLLTLPMYHVAGLQAALASVYGGRSVVIERQFEPGEWLALVESERVQRALLVPTMLKQVLDHPDARRRDLASLTVLTYGGAPMPPKLIERAIAQLPRVQFINAFGQTETGSTIAMVPPEDHVLTGPAEVVAKRRKRLTSIGRPLADVEVRVVDETGAPLPAGETGEIAARGPRLMRGYWGGDEEGPQAVRDGWLYTGDLGYVDDDGYIYLQGRAKDFIKRGGEMVSPEEVEQVPCSPARASTIARWSVFPTRRGGSASSRSSWGRPAPRRRPTICCAHAPCSRGSSAPTRCGSWTPFPATRSARSSNASCASSTGASAERSATQAAAAVGAGSDASASAGVSAGVLSSHSMPPRFHS